MFHHLLLMSHCSNGVLIIGDYYELFISAVVAFPVAGYVNMNQLAHMAMQHQQELSQKKEQQESSDEKTDDDEVTLKYSSSSSSAEQRKNSRVRRHQFLILPGGL